MSASPAPIPGNTRRLDWHADPLSILARLEPSVFPQLLHSGRYHPRWARRSLIGFPAGFLRFTVDDRGRGQTSYTPINGQAGPSLPTPTHDPLTDLQAALDATRDRGVWIGVISYDIGRWIERLPSIARDDRGWPVLELAWCPGVAAYDLSAQSWTWHGDTAPVDLLDRPVTAPPTRLTGPLEPTITREAYLRAAQKVIDYIGAGDIFQANYAQRFSGRLDGPWPGAARGLFERLAAVSPAWYGAWLPNDQRRALLSTSPELFLEMGPDRLCLTRPIKGTRPATQSADVLLRSEKDTAELNMIVGVLLRSEKDTAELNMIVDLLRNDLGRVSRFGTVRVVQPREIESHPTVHHGVATIQGELKPGLQVADLLRATMPGGSITGAPKVRAMEIIDELEPVRRGPYCGAIGWLTHDRLCLNVAIRTMLARGRDEGFDIDFSVGGGIVADSTAESEYQETLDKAQAMLRALGIAGV